MMNNLSHFCVFFILCILICTSCKPFKESEGRTNKIRNELLSLLGNDSAKLNFSVDSIPLSILHYIEKDAKERVIIANPSERMRESDSINEDNYDLPIRRLLFWKKIKNDYLIVLERGGRSHNMILLHFKDSLGPKLITSLGINRKPKHSYQYVIDGLENEKLFLLYNNKTKMNRRFAYY